MLTLIPRGGLCNRMRAICSAVELAKGSGSVQIEVLWTMDKELNCRFEELFRSIDGVRVRNVGRWHLRNVLMRLSRRHPLLARAMPRRMVNGNRLIELRSQGVDFANYFSSGHYTVESWVWFGISGSDFSIFEPSDSVLELSRRWGVDRQTVGIHIRQTDHVQAIMRSPVSAFEDRMRSFPNDTKFFLATDSESVRERLSAEFSDRLVIPHGELSRNSEQGIKQALAELVALSGCRKILGSWGSSYNETAAAMGQIELKICQK